MVHMFTCNGLCWVSTVEPEVLGLVPSFFDALDERPAIEQVMEKYIGGWDHFKGFKLDEASGKLLYPGDPPMSVLASTVMHDEQIRLYESGWTMILQKDGTFEVARLDG